MEPMRIHETLFILHKCSSTVERVHDAYEGLLQKGPLFAVNHFSHNLAYYVIMESVSFLDEYDSFFTEAMVEEQFKERVRNVRKVASPLYKKIRLWKDLDNYRNKVIAHGWRDKKNGNRLTVPHKKYYDVPRTNFELQLLKDLIVQLMNFIKIEFEVEAGWGIWLAYDGEQEERPSKNYDDINTELQRMLDEMNAIAKDIGKDYDILIKGYSFNEETGKSNNG